MAKHDHMKFQIKIGKTSGIGPRTAAFRIGAKSLIGNVYVLCDILKCLHLILAGFLIL